MFHKSEPESKEKSDNEETDKFKIVEARKVKRKTQKEKKENEKVKVPRSGQQILFKEKGSDDWKSGRTVGGYKQTSKYKHWKHILVGDDLIIERDFEFGIDDWREVTEEE